MEQAIPKRKRGRPRKVPVETTGASTSAPTSCARSSVPIIFATTNQSKNLNASTHDRISTSARFAALSNSDVSAGPSSDTVQVQAGQGLELEYLVRKDENEPGSVGKYLVVPLDALSEAVPNLTNLRSITFSALRTSSVALSQSSSDEDSDSTPKGKRIRRSTKKDSPVETPTTVRKRGGRKGAKSAGEESAFRWPADVDSMTESSLWCRIENAFSSIKRIVNERLKGKIMMTKGKKDVILEQSFAEFLSCLVAVDHSFANKLQQVMPTGLFCSICQERLLNPLRDAENEEANEEGAPENYQKDPENLELTSELVEAEAPNQTESTPNTSKIIRVQTETRAAPSNALKGVRPYMPPLANSCETLKELLLHFMTAHGRVWLPSNQQGSKEDEYLILMYLALGEYVCHNCERRAMPNWIHYRRHTRNCASWNERKQCEHCGALYFVRLEVRHRNRWCPKTATNPRFSATMASLAGEEVEEVPVVKQSASAKKQSRQSAQAAASNIRMLAKDLLKTNDDSIHSDSDCEAAPVAESASEIGSESDDEVESELLSESGTKKAKTVRERPRRIPRNADSLLMAKRIDCIKNALIRFTDAEWAANRLGFYAARHRRNVSRRLPGFFPALESFFASKPTSLPFKTVDSDSTNASVCSTTGLRKFSLPFSTVPIKSCFSTVLRQLSLFQSTPECDASAEDNASSEDRSDASSSAVFAFCGASVMFVEWNNAVWNDSADPTKEGFHFAVVCDRNRFIQIWRCRLSSSPIEVWEESPPVISHQLNLDSLLEGTNLPVAFRWLPVSIHENRAQYPDLHRRLDEFINLAVVAYQSGNIDLVLVPRNSEAHGSAPIFEPLLVARFGLTNDDTHVDVPTCLTWSSSDIRVFGVGYTSGIVALYNSCRELSQPGDVKTKIAPFQVFRAHATAVKSLEFSPVDAQHLVTTSVGRRLALWDTKQREALPFCGGNLTNDAATFGLAWFYRPPFAPYSRFFPISESPEAETQPPEGRNPEAQALDYYRNLLQNKNETLLNVGAAPTSRVPAKQGKTVRKAYCSAYDKYEHTALLIACDSNNRFSSGSTVQLRMVHPSLITNPPKPIFRESTAASISLAYSPWLDTCLVGNAIGELTLQRFSPNIEMYTSANQNHSGRSKNCISKRVISSCGLRLAQNVSTTASNLSIIDCPSHNGSDVIDPSCKACLVQYAILIFGGSDAGKVIGTSKQTQPIANPRFLEQAHGLQFWTSLAVCPHPKAPFTVVAANASGLIKLFSIRESWAADGPRCMYNSQEPCIADLDFLQLLNTSIIAAQSQP